MVGGGPRISNQTFFRRLGRAFGLTSLPTQTPTMPPAILATYDVGLAGMEPSLGTATLNISADAATVLTVSADRRYRIVNAWKGPTVDAVGWRVRRAGTNFNTSTPVTTEQGLVGISWWMQEGDQLQLTKGNALDTAISGHVVYEDYPLPA